MRLAFKFSAALTLGVAIVLSVQAWLHVQRIAELQEREIRDDVLILGRTLAAATAEVWSLGGKDSASGFVARAGARRDHTRTSLIGPSDVSNLPVVERRGGDGNWQVVAITPVGVGDKTVAAIQIVRDLPSERSYYDSILWTQALTTAVAALLSGLIALGVGVWFIGRPIRQLSNLAHRVASGSYSLMSDVKQRDEIGTLAEELNEMTHRLRESHQQVGEERRARTKALEQLRHADRLSTVGKLASSMAHELGTPLNVVSGRASMISSDDDVPEDARDNAKIIAEQAARMTGIIRELLDFSRRKALNRADTRIGDVLDHAVGLMDPVCEDSGVQLVIEGEVEATAEIDAGKTLQVLTNLMMNAIHAMPDGGTLTLKASREEVHDPKDRHASAGDFIRVDVRDEGFGIPEDRLPDIFKAFFTTKREGKGTGLGLSVCHGIVREHGGFITVDSDVGKGTCFSVYLPEKETA